MKKLICKACGNKIIPDRDNHYISTDCGQVGMATMFRKDEEKIYDTFDCDRCGCQYVVQERKRIFTPEYQMINLLELQDDEDDEE